ncbi:MAG: hypothetical protein VX519_08985 [Myxococcota bacterium]|nr:hypothetical protein [Myxococcota bacterium]
MALLSRIATRGDPMRHFSILLLLGSLSAFPVFVSTAHAQDDEDWLDDFEEEEDEEFTEREDEGDTEIDMDEDPENIEDEESLDDDLEDETDFLDEDSDIEADQIGGEGVDNAKIYRGTLNRVREMGYEEELINWERYLERYPNTLFRQHINERMEALTSEAYGERIEGLGGNLVDAGRAELDFNVPMHLESIDPRSRFRAGFEMGLPNHIAFNVDYEKQIFRELSAHGALQGRYMGLSAILGGKYAIIKSARTKSILTGMVDLMLNDLMSAAEGTSSYAAVRPVLGFGQRFDVAEGLDVQVQAGAELEFRGRIIYSGGFNAFVRINERVGAFIESSTNMKKGLEDVASNQRPFAFNVFTVGMRFQPGADQNTRFAVNTNVPYANNYWGHHFGAIQTEYRTLLD